MITGHIERNQVVIPVKFFLHDEANLAIDFVVDTGFAGFLTLPPSVVNALQLSYDQDIYANLADDSEVLLSVHFADIDWDGNRRRVRVLATGSRPLLGTSLLKGNEFVAQFVPNGLVTLEAV